MSELLESLKADLFSRRMLPLLALAALALIGALAYGVLGSKSSSSVPTTAPQSAHAEVAPLPGPALASAPADPNAAASETTVGVGYQHKGKMRNPFTPLPGSESSEGSSSATATSATSGGSTSSGGSESANGSGAEGSSGSGGSESSGGSQEQGSGGSTPPQSTIALYHLDVTLQRLSETGTPTGEPQSFHLTHPQPLPSKHKPLLAPLVVTGKGTGVVFALLREAILHGKASCVPNAGDCQAIDVKLHQGEELQYLQEDGSVLAYMLTVTKIERVNGGSASAAAAHTSSAAGRLIAKMHLSLPSSLALDSRLGTIVGLAHR
jgi:hypothetical protein